MTNQNIGTPTMPFLPSLGGGRIIAETFSIFFRGFFRIFPVGFAILFASYAIVYLFYGDLGQNLYDIDGTFKIGKMLIANITITIGSAIFMSVVTLSAVDFTLGHNFRLGGYLQVAVTSLLPIIILQIAYGIGVVLGFLLLIVPGIYLVAMWSVYLPSILIDQVGFRGLHRSAALTQNFRWSILGPIAVFFIVSYLFVIMSLLISMGNLDTMLNPQLGDISWLAVFTQAFGAALGGTLLSIGALVIFNRLKEIKEGGGVASEFAEVFD